MHLLHLDGDSSLALLVTSFVLIGTAVVLQAQPKRDRRPDKAPKVGEVAPTFVLESLDRKSKTDLASYQANKPIVLFFGSYT